MSMPGNEFEVPHSAREQKASTTRPLLTTMAVAAWGIGFNIALQKGWFNSVPTGVVIGALGIPILIFIYLGLSHKRAAKYYARHPRGVTALAVAVLLLVAGTAWWFVRSVRPATVWQASVPKMPSLHDLFLRDFDNSSSMRVGLGKEMERGDGTHQKAGEARVYWDFASRSKFMAFYILPSHDTYAICLEIADTWRSLLDEVEHKGLAIDFTAQDPAETHLDKSADLVFIGKVYVYYDDYFTIQELGDLEKRFAERGLSPVFRGPTYASTRWLQQRSSPMPK